MPLITIKFLAFKSDNLGLVANARNKDNYVLFNICKDSVSVYEISDNAWNDNVPYKNYSVHFMLPNIPTALNYR